ncbi:hypothetical protein GCM10010317_103850 [Streptomyces mirabilis]|nr:hypothetical protein GCM10010317_103850 [Streptomyces mirabilis]
MLSPHERGATEGVPGRVASLVSLAPPALVLPQQCCVPPAIPYRPYYAYEAPEVQPVITFYSYKASQQRSLDARYPEFPAPLPAVHTSASRAAEPTRNANASVDLRESRVGAVWSGGSCPVPGRP